MLIDFLSGANPSSRMMEPPRGAAVSLVPPGNEPKNLISICLVLLDSHPGVSEWSSLSLEVK